MKNLKLLVVLIGLIVIAGIYYFSNPKGSLKLRNTSFAIESIENITEIRISSDNEKLVLEKEFDHWKVNKKYRTRDWSIDNFMKAINRLDVVSPVSKVSKEQVASILKSDGILVEIFKKGRALKKYYVGKSGMNKEKTYMMMYKSSEPFVVNIPSFKGLVSDLFVVDENFWRDKTIFNYQPQNIKTIVIDYPQNRDKSFQLFNFGDGTFALKNAQNDSFVEDYNIEKAIRFFTYFQRIAFEDIVINLTHIQTDSVLNSGPFIVITIEDMKDVKNQLSIYRKPSVNKLDEFGKKAKFDYNKAYALFNDTNELILIQYYKFDLLFKEIDYFR